MDNVYSVSEIVGTSTESLDAAIRTGIARMSKTVENLDWFEVSEIRGKIAEDGSIDYFQATLKVGFKVRED